MKNLCKKNNIPTANFGVFDNFNEASNFIKKNGAPIVVKADGLAAGKGVSICKSIKEALKSTKEILDGKFKSSKKVVLEEFLEGEELSYFVIVDENSYIFLVQLKIIKELVKVIQGQIQEEWAHTHLHLCLTKNLKKKLKKKLLNPP